MFVADLATLSVSDKVARIIGSRTEGRNLEETATDARGRGGGEGGVRAMSHCPARNRAAKRHQ